MSALLTCRSGDASTDCRDAPLAGGPVRPGLRRPDRRGGRVGAGRGWRGGAGRILRGGVLQPGGGDVHRSHRPRRPPSPSRVGRSRAAYVASLYPDDVVFAHWAETLVAHVPAAAGRAISSLVAVQPAEEASWGGGRIVTTVERPRVPDLAASTSWSSWPPLPGRPRGLALPRRAARRLLGRGLPPATEAWAVHVAVAISCGVLETGEVTHLSRSLPSGGGPAIDQDDRERNIRAALEVLDGAASRWATGCSSPCGNHRGGRTCSGSKGNWTSSVRSFDGRTRSVVPTPRPSLPRSGVSVAFCPHGAGGPRRRCACWEERRGDWVGGPNDRPTRESRGCQGRDYDVRLVTWEKATRRISLGASGPIWSQFRQEIDMLAGGEPVRCSAERLIGGRIDDGPGGGGRLQRELAAIPWPIRPGRAGDPPLGSALHRLRVRSRRRHPELDLPRSVPALSPVPVGTRHF